MAQKNFSINGAGSPIVKRSELKNGMDLMTHTTHFSGAIAVDS
jgi:hypothetical protein